MSKKINVGDLEDLYSSEDYVDDLSSEDIPTQQVQLHGELGGV